jgi:hypothetical protein
MTKAVIMAGIRNSEERFESRFMGVGLIAIGDDDTREMRRLHPSKVTWHRFW